MNGVVSVVCYFFFFFFFIFLDLSIFLRGEFYAWYDHRNGIGIGIVMVLFSLFLALNHCTWKI